METRAKSFGGHDETGQSGVYNCTPEMNPVGKLSTAEAAVMCPFVVYQQELGGDWKSNPITISPPAW